MITKDFLERIEAAVFTPYFHEEMRALFQQNVAKGKFANDQKEYDLAKKH